MSPMPRPFEQREFIYNLGEALKVSGMGRATFFRSHKLYPLTFPTSKARIARWVRTLGYPRSKGMTLLTEQRIRSVRLMRERGYSMRNIAKVLGVSHQWVFKLTRMNLPKEAQCS